MLKGVEIQQSINISTPKKYVKEQIINAKYIDSSKTWLQQSAKNAPIVINSNTSAALIPSKSLIAKIKTLLGKSGSVLAIYPKISNSSLLNIAIKGIKKFGNYKKVSIVTLSKTKYLECKIATKNCNGLSIVK